MTRILFALLLCASVVGCGGRERPRKPKKPKRDQPIAASTAVNWSRGEAMFAASLALIDLDRPELGEAEPTNPADDQKQDQEPAGLKAGELPVIRAMAPLCDPRCHKFRHWLENLNPSYWEATGYGVKIELVPDAESVEQWAADKEFPVFEYGEIRLTGWNGLEDLIERMNQAAP